MAQGFFCLGALLAVHRCADTGSGTAHRQEFCAVVGEVNGSHDSHRAEIAEISKPDRRAMLAIGLEAIAEKITARLDC